MAGWLLVAVAQAEPSPIEKAEQFFLEGREAMKRQDYLGACNKFRASQKLDPAPGTALSIAECEEALGRPAVAHRYYREVLEKLPANDERATLAQRQRAALESKLGFVMMANIPPSYSYQLELYADRTHQTPVPTSPAETHGVWVAPGTYHLVLVIKGKELKISEEVQVQAGEQKRVVYKPPPVDPTQATTEPRPKEAPKGRTGTAIAWVGSGVGVLGLVLWLSGNDKIITDTGKILTGTGALALGVGLLVNLQPSKKKAQTVQIYPWTDLSVGISGATVGGTW
jgi:hypothetical protein